MFLSVLTEGLRSVVNNGIERNTDKGENAEAKTEK